MKFKIVKLFSLAIILLCSNVAFAQKNKNVKEITGIRAEIIVQIDAAEKKNTCH